MTHTILHGARNFAISPPKITSSPRRLDGVQQTFQSDRLDAFAQARQFPGFPLMEIEECETSEEIPGLAYEHRLRGTGLLRAGHKLESSEIKQPEEGWDEGPETWLTTKPEAFVVGSAHPDHPNLYLTAIESKERVTSKVSRIQCAWKGIVLDSEGQIKPERWKGTVNGQTVTTSAGVTLGSTGVPATEIFTDEDGVFNGWNDSRKAKFDTSQLNLIVTKLSLIPPPTERLGLQMTPGHIPVSVYSIFDEAWYSSLGFVYNYPAGWKLAGVQFDQVFDKACFLYTLTYAYQPEVEPIL